ncbi:hypothetical protein [Amycolatopsis sp. NPDC049159]|uniref:hypothetical protein n=1 Tax=Amycolatopsis sp. NPDC049159 TaxID=3157210 RepID=UPI0033FD1620
MAEQFEPDQRGLRDAEAADQLVEPQPADFDPEGVGEPGRRRFAVFEQRVDGLDGAEQPDLGDDAVDDVLAQAQVFMACR